MARSRSRRRSDRPVRPARQRPAPVAASGGRSGRGRRPGPPAGWWRGRPGWLLAALGGLVVVGLLIAAGVWFNQPPRPDANAVRADIQAHRAGAEVTFDGTVVSDPTSDGGHERMLVTDQLGDTLELDYNVTLGRVIPVHRGEQVQVHGQLYVDPGQAGVHCLHAVTSRGCPQPGWIDYRGTRYD